MGEVANIPRLRFPEFNGAWEESKLERFCNKIASGKSKQSDGGQYKLFGSTGVIGLADEYSNDGKYILIARVGANAGLTNVVEGRFSVTDNTLVVDLKDTVEIDFILSLLHKYNLNRLIFGSGQPLITGGQLKSLKLNFPLLPEQQKIAAFLTAVDNKIEQLSKKQELLSEYKKGLMQQIFSQAIRFKADDGCDFPDWEEVKLGDVCSKAKSGGTPRSTTKEYYDGDIPFLAISDITRQGKYLTSASKKISQLGIDNSASWIVPIDTIIYSMYASVGFVSINKIPLATSQAVINLIVKDCYSIEFIYYHLIEVKKTIHKFIETGTQGNLNAQTVKSLILNIPSLQEQTKIANFLSSIDSKVEQVGKQLDESKQFKKALLQQMFV